MPPHAFQKFARDFYHAQSAWTQTEPARPALRLVVVTLVALSAMLIFQIGWWIAGWPAALIAWAAWCGSPTVQVWSHYLRPDFFSVTFVLATLAAMLAWQAQLTGARGLSRRVLAATGLGLLTSCAVSSKLNGATAAIFVSAALPLAAWILRKDLPRGGRPLAALCTLAWVGLIALALFLALNPVLWQNPIGESSEILAFWDRHMAMQQDRWEQLDGRVARTVGERFQLALTRLWRREEPIAALTGIPGGLVLVPAGLALIAARVIGPWRAQNLSERWQALVFTIWIVAAFLITTFWLPLDWDRYFFVYIAAIALAEGVFVGALAKALWTRIRRAA